MKRAIIVHCWEGYPEYCWYQSTKQELEAAGFEVQVPAMPDTEHPKMLTWVTKLQEVIGEPDGETYLIGHSVGCITVLRYLESLADEQRVAGVVLVAGFSEKLGEGYEEIDNFFATPVDFDQVRSRTNKFVAIVSDNDPYVPMRHGEIFRDQLGAELIIKHEMGHFSGHVDDEASCDQLPEVAEAIKKM